MSPLESSDSSSTVASIKKFSRSVSIPQPVLSMVSGAGAGILCTLICAPLDVAKVRMQVQGGLGMNKYHGVFSSVSYIYTEEGLRGLFRGVGPAMITIPLFWGCYWPIYDSMKTFLAENHSKESISMQHLISAVCAGAVGDIITNPFWVTRTRFQTLALHKELAGIDPNISTFQMMRRIYEEEGIHAFYRGLGASFLGLSHVAIQFPLCKCHSSMLYHHSFCFKNDLIMINRLHFFCL